MSDSGVRATCAIEIGFWRARNSLSGPLGPSAGSPSTSTALSDAPSASRSRASFSRCSEPGEEVSVAVEREADRRVSGPGRLDLTGLADFGEVGPQRASWDHG